MRAYREHIAPAMSTILSRVVDEAIAWQPDVIVSHPKLLTVPIVAEYLGIPYLTVELAPVLTATVEFPAAGVLSRSYGPVLNRLSYRVPALGGRMFAADIRAARQRLGVSRSHRVSPSAGSLIAVSPSLLARPSDWPVSAHLTGDWPRQSRPGEVLTPGFRTSFLILLRSHMPASGRCGLVTPHRGQKRSSRVPGKQDYGCCSQSGGAGLNRPRDVSGEIS